MANNSNHDVKFNEDKLNSFGQESMRQIVRSLPEETVSMAWRSSLNEQLLGVAAKQRKKQRFLGLLRPALGLSMAAALAVVVMFHPTKPVTNLPSTRGVESAILSDHHNSALLNEVSTAGLNANEVTTDANSEDPGDGLWTESDVQGL